MEIMKPIAREQAPTGMSWAYEIKYDGYRCTLHWTADGVRLISKNNKEMTANFPEITAFCQQLQPKIASFLPIVLDGELTVLNTAFQANFSWIQKRGRLKKATSIQKAAHARPATLMVFDLLKEKGSSLAASSYLERRKKLLQLFENLLSERERLQIVTSYSKLKDIAQIVFDYKCEGIIAKRKKSIYKARKNHQDWFKIKNWRIVHAILTNYQPGNDYFTAAVWKKNELVSIGQCKHGLDAQAVKTVKQVFGNNGSYNGKSYALPPAIVASIRTLDLYQGELREPSFQCIEAEMDVSQCTLERLMIDQAMLPAAIDYSNTEKIYWPKAAIDKAAYLVYMREISAFMLPFLQNRLLTLIRCPEGVEKESFFQKHLPDYAPVFIDRMTIDGETFMICNSLKSLMWFANHGGIEFHVPFNQADSPYPNEIVFDLDPPSRERFDLAIQAAVVIKELLDKLQLKSFVKLSGSKGLQIHIPIKEKSMTYEQTALFTQGIAQTVENQYANLFTTERMKKNRHGRLYIDYVQHGKNKTIVTPYSARKKDEGTVAAPLFWKEVNDDLLPQQFTIHNVVDRVKEKGCPFADYQIAREQQNMNNLFSLLE